VGGPPLGARVVVVGVGSGAMDRGVAFDVDGATDALPPTAAVVGEVAGGGNDDPVDPVDAPPPAFPGASLPEP